MSNSKGGKMPLENLPDWSEYRGTRQDENAFTFPKAKISKLTDSERVKYLGYRNDLMGQYCAGRVRIKFVKIEEKRFGPRDAKWDQ